MLSYNTFEDDMIEMLENEEEQEFRMELYDDHSRYVPMLREDLITKMNGSIRKEVR